MGMCGIRFVLRKHWWSSYNGGHYHGRKSGPYQRLVVGVAGGGWMEGLDCLSNLKNKIWVDSSEY